MSRLLLILAVGLCLRATDARAQLSICNDTDIAFYAALAAPSDRTDGSEWTASGWYTLPPHGCSDLVAELRYRYYYLYVETMLFRTSVRIGHKEIWGHSSDRPLVYGDYPFCVSPSDAFETAGTADCEAQDYEQVGFREIDVGEHASFVLPIGAAPGTSEDQAN